jgi:DNA-binding MarR family transcriptional regulator
MKNKSPIGYYLKKADNLLTEGINDIHKEFNINRTQWQILNSLNESNSIDRNKIIDVLIEFADKESISNTIEIMKNRELIKEDEQLELTENGTDVFNKCFQRQTEFRNKFMKNISEQEYLQTITALEKIIVNLK